jgi:hypothetical protein
MDGYEFITRLAIGSVESTPFARAMGVERDVGKARATLTSEVRDSRRNDCYGKAATLAFMVFT